MKSTLERLEKIFGKRPEFSNPDFIEVLAELEKVSDNIVGRLIEIESSEKEKEKICDDLIKIVEGDNDNSKDA